MAQYTIIPIPCLVPHEELIPIHTWFNDSKEPTQPNIGFRSVNHVIWFFFGDWFKPVGGGFHLQKRIFWRFLI